MIGIENLTKTYPSGFTLSVPSLSIEKGERVALIGLNGSGKSTFLRLIAGAEKPDGGEISLAKDTRLGYLPQTPYAFSGTVDYNVRLAAGKRNVDETLFARFQLDVLRNKKMTELSGGERQRVFLARMLAGEYDLLLLDEPLSAADLQTGETLLSVLLDYCREKNVTLLFSTHLPKQALILSTRVLLFDGGKAVEDGAPGVLSAPESEFGRRFISQWKV